MTERSNRSAGVEDRWKRAAPIAPRILIALVIALAPFEARVEAAETDKERWNEKYSGDTYRFGKDPIPYLVEQISRLSKGKALDLAMGEGRNGVFLATKGFQVTGQLSAWLVRIPQPFSGRNGKRCLRRKMSSTQKPQPAGKQLI